MRKLVFILFLFTATVANAQTASDNRSYSLKEIDEAPVPESGVSLENHFKKNFHPSEKVTEAIKVSFMIEKGGVIHDIKVFNELTEDNKKEVVRVIKMLPKWKPGKKSGNAVRVLYTATLKT